MENLKSGKLKSSVGDTLTDLQLVHHKLRDAYEVWNCSKCHAEIKRNLAKWLQCPQCSFPMEFLFKGGDL